MRDAFGEWINEYDYLQNRQTGKMFAAINIGEESVEALDCTQQRDNFVEITDTSKYVKRHAEDFMFLASQPSGER